MPAITNQYVLDLAEQWINGNKKHVQGELYNLYRANKSPFDCMFLAVDLYLQIKIESPLAADQFYNTLQVRFHDYD